MSIDFDIVINSPDDSVDMKSGLNTLQGISDAARCIAETVLCNRVPEKQLHTANVRTKLKQSFKGSYGQKFSVEIYDEKPQRKLKEIGKSAFVELVAYFLNDAIYSDTVNLSLKAQKVVDSLGIKADALTERLRASSLKDIHQVSLKFEHDAKIRFRKNRDEQIILAQFNQNTARVLEATHSKEKVNITAGITRLNTHTGNGRLQIIGANETVAFGFDGEYKNLRITGKKKFSENLHHNNGISKEHWKYLEIEASTIQIHGGKIIKYIVEAIRV